MALRRSACWPLSFCNSSFKTSWPVMRTPKWSPFWTHNSEAPKQGLPGTERTLRVPESCYRAVFFTLDHVSLSCFTAVVSNYFVVTRRCRCLLQSVRVFNVMPWRLLGVISGILAGGIPGFHIEPCCFPHPSSGPWWFRLWSCCCFILWACQHDTQVIICMRWDDNKLSPLASTDLFHINWKLSRYGFVALWLFFFCVGFVCCLVLFWCFCFAVVLCFSFLGLVFVPWNVTSLWTMYRSFSSLLLRPLQHWPLC